MTFDGQWAPDSVPCDENLIMAARLRCFNGPATNEFCRDLSRCPLPSLGIPQLDSTSLSLQEYLDSAVRSNEANWVNGIIDAVEFRNSGDYVSGAFVKFEPYPGKTDETFKPRLIISCPDWVKGHLGPHVASVVNHWKSLVHSGLAAGFAPPRCPAFGFTRDTIGDWVELSEQQMGEPVCYVECDCSAWDSTVSFDALLLEFSWYMQHTNMNAKALYLLSLQLCMKWRNSTGDIVASRVGGRASGVPNTSCGNTVINLLLSDFAVSTLKCKANVIAMGDDMLCIAPASFAEDLCSAFTTTFKRAGFKPVCKYSTVMEEAEFCSSYISRSTDGRYVAVPKPGKQVMKLTRCDIDNGFAFQANMSASAAYSSCPWLRESARLTCARYGWETGQHKEEVNPYSVSNGVRVGTWESHVQRYGFKVTPLVLTGIAPADVMCMVALDVGEFEAGDVRPYSMPPIRATCTRPSRVSKSSYYGDIAMEGVSDHILRGCSKLFKLVSGRPSQGALSWALWAHAMSNQFERSLFSSKGVSGTFSGLDLANKCESKEGAEWLTAVLDPYHDYNLAIKGVPDKNPSLSFLRQYKDRVNVTAPTAGADFDLHVFFTPFVYRTKVRDTQRVPPYIAPVNYIPMTPSSFEEWGFVTAVAVPAGGTLHDPLRKVYPLGPIMSSQLGLSPSRVVCGAFEVHNTTAKLYEGGALTVWKGNLISEDEIWDDSGVGRIVDVTLGAPNVVGLANALPTSRTWEASKGVYMVAQPNLDDMRFSNCVDRDLYTASSNNSTDDGYFGFMTERSGGKGLTPSRVVPSGCIMTGLNANSTITIDIRMIVEYCPALAAADIALATPTCRYDATAIAAAAKIFEQLPPGVPVSMNGAGDFFRGILRIASKILPVLAPLLPGVGKVIATAASPALSAVSHAVDKHAAAKKNPSPGGTVVTSTAGRMVQKKK